MDSLSLVVDPASPTDCLRPSLSQLPSSSTTTTAATTPELTPDDHERSSSESAIVSIYSMYEDDAGSASAHRQSKAQEDANWAPRPAEDSGYLESSWQHPSAAAVSERHSYGGMRARTSLSSQRDSLRAPSRVLSTSTDSSVSTGSALSPPMPFVGLPNSPRPQTRSITESQDERTPAASSQYPPNAWQEPPPQQSQQPDQLELPQPQPQPGGAHLQVPPSPRPRVASGSSASMPAGVPSLVPSPDEDPDGFHVRSTYAQLDVWGVRGDGIEEGVERTRARVGGSRASELRAHEALANADEKTRELTTQEVSMLASLDRYGFFVTPTHDRTILLPVAPLLKPLARMATANTNGPTSAPTVSSLPQATISPKELARVAKWGRMLEARSRDPGQNVDAWGIKAAKEHKLHERTFKGIPDCWRSAAWDTLMCRFSKHGKAETTRLAEEYRKALERPSTYDVQIDLDVPRTISGHIMFRTRYGKGQRSLFHVLHCLSLHCDTCGYCQGMGPIAATLLCYFEPTRTYAALVRLHDAYQMHTIFQPGFPGLLEAIYVQERITEQLMPAVYAAFKKHMVSTTSYATKWYITLFANSVPFQTQLRLWDVFLLEGHDIFVVIAVAIVWVYRDHITSDSANFETVLSLLSSFFVPEDENALLSWIGKVISDKRLRSSMQQWRADWQRLVAAGQHNQALL